MSTFTSFNGPGQSLPSTKAITELINAYNDLSTKLASHIADNVGTTGSVVHNAKNYIDEVKSALINLINNKADSSKVGNGTLPKINGTAVSDCIDAINKLNNYLDGNFAKNNVLNNYVAKTSASDKASSSDKLQTKSEVKEAIDDLAINTYAKKSDVSNAIEELSTKLSDGTFNLLYAKVIRASERLYARLNADVVIDYTKWQLFAAPFAGTGNLDDVFTQGIFILGCLSKDWQDDTQAPNEEHKCKTGTAYIKYINTHPWDALINYTATYTGVSTEAPNGWTGSLEVHISKEAKCWKNMAFHLVCGTDYSGKTSVYLGVSADGMSKNDTDYVTTNFRACGINFIPVGATGYINPTGLLHHIVSASIGASPKGIVAFSNISLNEVSDKDGNLLFKTTTSTDPVTGEEVKMLVIGNTNEDIVFATRPQTFLKNDDGTISEYPLVATKDIQYISVPLGGILRWAPENADGTLKNVPDGWLDISHVNFIPASTYPELADLLGTDTAGNIKLPIETHSIIKAKYFDIMSVDDMPDVEEMLNYKALKLAITNEVTRASTAETALDTKIETEKLRATAKETELDTKIDVEVARAKAEEARLQALIDALPKDTAVVGSILTLATDTTTNAVPDCYLLCSGQELSKTDYADLYSAIGDLFGTATSADKFLLPDLRNRFIQFTDGTAGEYKEAAIPNITGIIGNDTGAGFDYYVSNGSSGVFYAGPQHSGWNCDGATTGGAATVHIDASRASGVYKNGVDTVQPPAVTLNGYIRYKKG